MTSLVDDKGDDERSSSGSSNSSSNYICALISF